MENNEISIEQVEKPLQNKKSNWSELWDFVKFAILALIVIIPIRIFVAQPFIVSGESMDPTFETSQYLIIDELTYSLKEPQRGDVVVFRYPKDLKTYFIKRIIGLPGETVQIKNNIVTIINKENPQGFVLDEPYIKTKMTTDDKTYTSKQGEYFVMGDNRNRSYDSRAWGGVTKKELIGKTFLRLFPLHRIEFLPGDYNDYK